jgi:hypothetical protein
MSAPTCPDCGADSGTVGVVDHAGEAAGRILCASCMRREGLMETLADRYFGIGVPGLIAEECYALRDLLHAKNAAYGNSAFQPIRIFSRADPVEAILVRLDDKLSRLARGSAAGEDVELDILGYLILLRVARRMRPEKP